MCWKYVRCTSSGCVRSLCGFFSSWSLSVSEDDDAGDDSGEFRFRFVEFGLKILDDRFDMTTEICVFRSWCGRRSQLVVLSCCSLCCRICCGWLSFVIVVMMPLSFCIVDVYRRIRYVYVYTEDARFSVFYYIFDVCLNPANWNLNKYFHLRFKYIVAKIRNVSSDRERSIDLWIVWTLHNQLFD